MKPCIQVEELSKRFRLGARRDQYRTIRESVAIGFHAVYDRLRGAEAKGTRLDNVEFWGLKDVSFDVHPGDVVGLIGRNGAGKSTLLKILSRISEPTSGSARIRGRVGSLLEVGTGFHHELTGRENIFLNGSILGMSRREITSKFDDIVQFAEVDRFLDTPVKRYSSGMYIRLAFAIAAHLDLEVLFVDEVLAVGDQQFQNKCLGKMGDIARSGRTIVLVSHNMASIIKLCNKVVYLNQGRLEFCGACTDGVSKYIGENKAEDGQTDLTDHRNRQLGSQSILRSIRLLNKNGGLSGSFGCGDSIEIIVEAEVPTPGDYNLRLSLDDHMGVRLFSVATNVSPSGPQRMCGRTGISCRIDKLTVMPGKYAWSVMLGPSQKPPIDTVDQAMWMDVIETDFLGGGRLPHSSEGKFLVRSHWKPVDPFKVQ